MSEADQLARECGPRTAESMSIPIPLIGTISSSLVPGKRNRRGKARMSPKVEEECRLCYNLATLQGGYLISQRS
jgi:hypothetical protein